jgi:hypothetical protein
MSSLLVVFAVASAWAQDTGASPKPLSDDETPPEEIVLKVVPPRASYDVAALPGYMMLPQFADVPGWLSIGARAAGGRHFRDFRVGGGLSFTLEGPIGLQWSNVFEPQFMWDWQSSKGLFVGMSVGPTLMINSQIQTGQRGLENSFSAGPMLAVRMGWSQPHNLLMRRIFVGVEPKFRWINGNPAFGVSLVVGSGAGR